jgi:hypothetical protein
MDVVYSGCCNTVIFVWPMAFVCMRVGGYGCVRVNVRV